MAKVGRPSKRTPEVEAKILDGLSAGITLNRLCVRPDMPDSQTVLRWKREDDKFRAAYARAREDGAEAMADRIVDMADNALQARDIIEINAVRQATENLKWAAGKFNQQFGDKVKTEHSGEVNVITQKIVLDKPPPGWKGTA